MRRITGRRTASALMVTVGLAACERAPKTNVIPEPMEVDTGSGAFVIDATTSIAIGDPTDEVRRIADLWAGPFRENAGLPLPIDGGGSIRLAISASGPAEGYSLDVSPTGIDVVGNDSPGLFYGLQTLSQLMPPGTEVGGAPADAPLDIGAVSITDAPRFSYRGMHLDVARHFFGPDFVKRYIDLLARYKLNRFHWHLTEDQGWRIQIDAYPRLTEISAFRDQTQIGRPTDTIQGDGQRYGGFYTKDEIRDIVAYAQERFVTIVPEIEMPGHSSAVLAAYPELACTDGPFQVAQTWGVFEDIYCPSEETFTFLENVLSEVVELFPGEYVHIGGDEAPKARWEESDEVRDLMQREGIFEVEQVQGYFIRRIEQFLQSKGKRIIGWDEILAGGVSPTATVMSWRGILGGIEASRRGNDVVMTPTNYLYFDYYQSQDTASEPLAIGGYLPLDTVYSYDPVPPQLRAEDAAHIIGAQANLWTEYIATPEHAEYMLLPRMLALSEDVWSPEGSKDFGKFRKRLRWHLDRFDALGVRYRPLDGG